MNEQGSGRMRVAFKAWAAVLAAGYGVVFFGLVSLVLGWFQPLEGVAGPVTDLGYGSLVGIILTVGLLVQVRAPERKIAAMQQTVLVIAALVIGSALAQDSQNLIPALILVPTLGILLALHPARKGFLRPGGSVSPALLVLAGASGIPLIAYALHIGAEAQKVTGPPHHVQRLSTMAALAIAILLTGLLAALRTRGWTVPAWSAGSAVLVFGLASMAFPGHPGAEGRWWAGLAIAGGVLFIAAAEWEARRGRQRLIRPDQALYGGSPPGSRTDAPLGDRGQVAVDGERANSTLVTGNAGERNGREPSCETAGSPLKAHAQHIREQCLEVRRDGRWDGLRGVSAWLHVC